MAFSVQTSGDEAIYMKFPGASGKPTPASGRSISSLGDGFKELRKIKDPSGKVVWAHKWRLKITGEHMKDVNFTKKNSSDPDLEVNKTSDPLGTKPFARCKDGYSIVAEVLPDMSSGYIFEKWADGNTDNPRTFYMDQHRNFEAKMKLGYEVTIKALSNSGIIYHGFVGGGDTLDLTNLQIDAGNKAVLDTLEDFTPSYNDNTHVNLKKSGFRGWTLDILKGTMGGSPCDIPVSGAITITGTTVVTCSWTKQIRNKYMRTSKAINKPDLSMNFFLFQIAGPNEVALPVGGKLYVSDVYGLLSHMGNLTTHPMLIFASVNDITATDDVNRSDPDADSKTKHDETSWKLPQLPDFGNFSSIKDEKNTGHSFSLPAHSSTKYDSGKGWDILSSSKFRPFAPRVTPFAYEDWYAYIMATTQFEPSITKAADLEQYKIDHAAEYEDWSTLRTIFTMRSTVFNHDDEKGDMTLIDHMAMINAGKWIEITDSTVILDTMQVYISDNFGHDKDFAYILDCCSDDFTRNIPAGTVNGSFYDYFWNSEYSFPGYGWKICTNDPEDQDEIIEVFNDSSEDRSLCFEPYKVYYFRFTDYDTGEVMTYYIPMSNTSAFDYIYPIYHGETLGEYKQRVAGYTKQTVEACGIHLFQQDTSSSSTDAIYVTKSTGEGTTAATVHAKQTSSGLSIPEKLGTGNKPCGLHLTMLKSNSGCTVSWKFFLYSLKINLY